MLGTIKNLINAAAAPTEAERALIKFDIAYCKQPDGTLVVDGDLDLSDKNLTALPNLTDVIVKGSFKCCRNKLTSLKGCPQDVGKDFWCYVNELTDLEHTPKIIHGDFQAHNNKLITLKGGPEETGGGYSVMDNALTSLIFGPKKVGATFYVARNPLKSLKHMPDFVGNSIAMQECGLTTLEHVPETLPGELICHENPLASLEHAPQSFQRLHSDLGEFASWDAIPENLAPDRTRRKEERIFAFTQGATVLQRPLTTRGPLRLKIALQA